MRFPAKKHFHRNKARRMVCVIAMNLNEAQQKAVTEWIAAGAKLSEVNPGLAGDSPSPSPIWSAFSGG